MTSKIGSFKAIGEVIKSDAERIEQAAKEVAGGKGSALKEVATDVGDTFMDVGAGSIGVAEMFGLQYPVSNYSQQVSTDLTRGSRLQDGQMDQLAKQGFKGIVNLCAENDMDSAPAAKAGINAFHLPIVDNTAPTEGQMKQFLDFATNPANEPCYVHCEAGKGRTGIAVACYRMAVQGWSPEKAIAEAKSMGMAVPDQADFLRQFGADLAAGKIDGYPKT
jgi:protein tyrosine phosphatase (PTP) superfamily phosphohydrolase (DUF442 family)